MKKSIKTFYPYVLIKVLVIVLVCSFTNTENATASESSSSRDAPKTGVIFTIDGGGVRGIIPMYLMCKLEEKVGCPLVDKVDIWGGTSIGGIAVLALNKPSPDDPSRPAFLTADVLRIIQSSAGKIFEGSFMNRVKAGWGLWAPMYSGRGVEKMLADNLGDYWLSESLGKVIVSGFDTSRNTPMFFKSASAKVKSDLDFYAADVGRFTSAAQTYFPLARIQSRTGWTIEGIDGGNVANNITASALIEGRQRLTDAQDWLVVNFGTGKTQATLNYDIMSKKGMLGWVKPTIDITMNGQAEVVDYQMKELLPPLESHEGTGYYKQRYFRFQPTLPDECADLDNASPENIRRLLLIAENYAREHDHELDAIAEELRARPLVKRLLEEENLGIHEHECSQVGLSSALRLSTEGAREKGVVVDRRPLPKLALTKLKLATTGEEEDKSPVLARATTLVSLATPRKAGAGGSPILSKAPNLRDSDEILDDAV